MDKLTYTRVGGYLIPNLTIPERQVKPIGKYGRMRREYLKQHRTIYYQHLLLEGKLYSHLASVDEVADERLDALIPLYAQAAGVTEELKASDQMKWIGLMNNAKAQVEEIILAELIYE